MKNKCILSIMTIFLMLFMLTPKIFAETVNPEDITGFDQLKPSVGFTQKDLLIFGGSTQDVAFLIMYEDPAFSDFKPYEYYYFGRPGDSTYSPNSYFIQTKYPGIEFKVMKFLLNHGSTDWALGGTSSVSVQSTPTLFFGSGDNLIYSSNDVYLKDGSLFFQVTPSLTLAEEVQQMVAVEAPAMGTKVLLAMKTILLCGVGCLAFLISLPLFGKAFRMFQVK